MSKPKSTFRGKNGQIELVIGILVRWKKRMSKLNNFQVHSLSMRQNKLKSTRGIHLVFESVKWINYHWLTLKIYSLVILCWNNYEFEEWNLFWIERVQFLNWFLDFLPNETKLKFPWYSYRKIWGTYSLIYKTAVKF